jgi:hypothetical protein
MQAVSDHSATMGPRVAPLEKEWLYAFVSVEIGSHEWSKDTAIPYVSAPSLMADGDYLIPLVQHSTADRGIIWTALAELTIPTWAAAQLDFMRTLHNLPLDIIEDGHGEFVINPRYIWFGNQLQAIGMESCWYAHTNVKVQPYDRFGASVSGRSELRALVLTDLGRRLREDIPGFECVSSNGVMISGKHYPFLPDFMLNQIEMVLRTPCEIWEFRSAENRLLALALFDRDERRKLLQYTYSIVGHSLHEDFILLKALQECYNKNLKLGLGLDINNLKRGMQWKADWVELPGLA